MNNFLETSWFSQRQLLNLKIHLNMGIHNLNHPPHKYSAKFGSVLLYCPHLFGKKLFSMQDKLVNNKQTHLLKQNFSETITPLDKCCMLLFILSINPVVDIIFWCWCWSLFRIITSELECIYSRFGTVCRWEDDYL